MFFSHDVVFDKIFSSALAYMSRPYSEALATRPAVLYISFATYSHEKTGNVVTFAQFEEGNLLENECNLLGDQSISDSIDDSSTKDNSDEIIISTKTIKYIWYLKHVYPNINVRDARFKIHDRISKTQS